MNGYGSHTFLINAQGERVWCKFHFKTMQGIENLTQSESGSGRRPDHSTRDLFEAIERQEYPKWRVCASNDRRTGGASPDNAFDLTKVWKHSEYPLD